MAVFAALIYISRMNKSVFNILLAGFVSAFFVACTATGEPENTCLDERVSIMCEAYGPNDECGNPTCASQDVIDSLHHVQDSILRTLVYDAVEESGRYTTKDSVAAYLCKFDKLPANYVGKNEGKKLYESKTGNTFEKWNFNPWTTIDVMIGGDNFDNFSSNPENFHEKLPEGSYHEADVDYSAKNRGTKRLVYQPDCVIYYTSDHYETFTRLEVK